ARGWSTGCVSWWAQSIRSSICPRHPRRRTAADVVAGQGALEVRRASLRVSLRRPIALAALGFGVLAVALLAAVGFGSVAVAPSDTLGILVHRLFLVEGPHTWSATAETIVWDLRLPR